MAVRVHFDASGGDTGGLGYLPGSHSRGRWTEDDLRRVALDSFEFVECRTGDLLLMKPLVVHRSPRASRPKQRRVLHVLYAPTSGWHATGGRAPGES